MFKGESWVTPAGGGWAEALPGREWLWGTGKSQVAGVERGGWAWVVYNEPGIDGAHLEGLQTLLLKVRSSHHQRQHQLGAGKECRISSPIPHLLDQILPTWFTCTLKFEKHCLQHHVREVGLCLSSLWKVLSGEVTHPNEHLEKITWATVWSLKGDKWGYGETS